MCIKIFESYFSNDFYLNEKVIKALKKASKPALTNISIDWMEIKHNVSLSYPKPQNVPYIYEEEPFNFYAILSENDLQESNFTLTFYDTLKGTEETLLLKIDPSQIIESNEGQDFQMTAKHYLEDLSRSKEKIDDSEIVSISVEYSVLNSKTAFFGKIKNSIKSTEEMKTIEIPVKKLQKESLIMEEKFRCLSSNVHLQRNVMICNQRSAQMHDLACKSENLSMQSKQFKREAKKSSPGIFSKIGSAIGGLFGSKKSKAAPYESSCAVQRDNSGCRDQIMECMDECMDICDSAPMSSTSSASSKKKKESEVSSSSGYMEIAKYQSITYFLY